VGGEGLGRSHSRRRTSRRGRAALTAAEMLPPAGPVPRLRADVLALALLLDHVGRWFFGLRAFWAVFWVSWLSSSVSPRALTGVHGCAKQASMIDKRVRRLRGVVAAAAVASRLVRLLCSRLILAVSPKPETLDDKPKALKHLTLNPKP